MAGENTILDENEMMFTVYEPKHKNRFVLYFNDANIPSYLIKAAKRPSVKLDVQTIDHINVQRKVGGKATWDDLTITLYDPVSPSAAQAVMEWVRMSHESITGRDGYAEMYKKDLTINVLGPVGDKIEQWDIKGAFITNADFGDLDYSTAELQTITLTLSIDYAILQY